MAPVALDESARLLVLGAGPAQLGVLAAARRRGLTIVAADRDPSAPGFRYADRRAIVSIEDEPAIDRLARAERVDGIVAPGTDHAVGDGCAHRRAARAAAPGDAGGRRARRLAPAPARAARRHRPAAAALDRLPHARRGDRRQPPALGYPVVVEAPDRSGERGVALAPDHAALTAAAAVALAESRGDYCLVEELVAGRVVTVNAFSLDGRFVPLTVTDREQAPPPAFGVPLAHLWPAELDPHGGGRRGRDGRRRGSARSASSTGRRRRR